MVIFSTNKKNTEKKWKKIDCTKNPLFRKTTVRPLSLIIVNFLKLQNNIKFELKIACFFESMCIQMEGCSAGNATEPRQKQEHLALVSILTAN